MTDTTLPNVEIVYVGRIMPALIENGQVQRIVFTYGDAIGWVDGESLAFLSANNQATALQDRARVQFDKLKASNPLADEMRQLRRLYVNTAPGQRLALEMAVLRALRSPL